MLQKPAQKLAQASRPSPISVFFQRMLEPIMTNEPKNDKWNPYNVKRWKLIIEENLERGDHGRAWNALEAIFKNATNADAPNRLEAIEALSRLHVQNKEGSYAEVYLSKTAHQLLANCSFSLEEAPEIAEMLIRTHTEGMSPVERLTYINNTLFEQIAETKNVPPDQLEPVLIGIETGLRMFRECMAEVHALAPKQPTDMKRAFSVEALQVMLLRENLTVLANEIEQIRERAVVMACSAE